MWANSVTLTDAENRISIQSAKKQLADAPYQTGESGTPLYLRKWWYFFHEPEGTSFMEYPIFGTETIKKTQKIYNYGSKPKIDLALFE